jgi:hypothetical protein
MENKMDKFVVEYLQKMGFRVEKIFIYDGEAVLHVPRRTYHENVGQVKKELKQYFNLIAHVRESIGNFEFAKRVILAERVRTGKLTQEEFQMLVK